MADARAVAVLTDLRDESDEVDALVTELAPAEWARATPAAGWSIAHQVAHLEWTDRQALLAAEDPDAFAAELKKATAALDTFVDEGAERGARLAPGELLQRWREGRESLQRVLRERPQGEKMPWFGPPMSAASVATGRLMETWAHGLDIAEAVGVRREPTVRLRHVARIGVRARDFAFTIHGLTPPEEEFRVELRAPDGELWTYGPEGAAQRVSGTALDFCLLATQRAHPDDVNVRAEGADAERWLGIAQAFAGPPGKGRAPRAEDR